MELEIILLSDWLALKDELGVFSLTCGFRGGRMRVRGCCQERERRSYQNTV